MLTISRIWSKYCNWRLEWWRGKGIGRRTRRVCLRNTKHIYNVAALTDWIPLIASTPRRVLFRKCDVSKWDDVLELFQETWKTFGIINAVLSNAGVTNENFLEDEIDPETGKLLPPNVKTIDINLTATIYVVKCAVHYFKKWPETRCQIVMTGSAASFIDTPPLHLYCASKAGILGFMRSLRTQLIKNNNVTVNMVAPWMTSKFCLTVTRISHIALLNRTLTTVQ